MLPPSEVVWGELSKGEEEKKQLRYIALMQWAEVVDPSPLRFGGTGSDVKGQSRLCHIGLVQRAEVVNPHSEEVPNFQAVFIVGENSG